MTKPGRRQELAEAIAQEGAHLAALEREVELAKQRLSELQAELVAIAYEPEIHVTLPIPQAGWIPRTAAEKVRLFRQLFRGREDVYPNRFVSKKTGKPGYAPVCANKFAVVCELTIGGRCGDCRSQAFLPVDDDALVGHLMGRHVMGVYPLLPDETCWFLAVDVDKGSWMEDVRAFMQTCKGVGLPVAVERSRSGNGAHVWFFCSAPVPAVTAREMGCYLLTETMARRHELSMDSYDRLFPSQDTMPKGGFGNLIALPLQHEPRQSGNSVFLDDQLAPFPDDQQWAFLASVPRIDPSVVAQIAREAAQLDRVLGVRHVEPLDDDEATPWTRPPSRKRPPPRVIEPLPEEIKAVLAQRLFVEKAGLPSALLNQIKRLAAFQNPEFYKRQSMRLSTALTPRVVMCAEDLPQHIALPRGCLPDLAALCKELSVHLNMDDQREAGTPVEWQFRGQLTPTQAQAARSLLTHDTGVFLAPPGVGKTVVGTHLVAARGCSSLILVHRRQLLDQWIVQLSVFLGIEPKEIGLFGAGKRKPNGRLDVAMIQSLVRGDQVNDVVASYGQVIVDECHHLSAVSFERVLAEVRARYVVGLTATLQRRDGHHPITTMQLGPVRFAISAKSQAAQRPFKHRLIVRETSFSSPSTTESPSIQELYATLATDEARNQLILADVVRALKSGRTPILLTERKSHLDDVAARLAAPGRHLIILRGGMSAKDRKSVNERLSAASPGEEKVILATGRYIGEGFDDPSLDTLFLALPISWKGTLVQHAGRLHRLHPGKTEVCIYDYVDRKVPMLLRMFERRLRGYRSIGYANGEAPLGYAPSQAEAEAETLTLFDDDDVA